MSGLYDSIWQALPLPGLLIDRDNRILELNPAAESFLNAGLKSLSGKPLAYCLKPDGDIDSNLNRARQGQSPLFHRDLTLRPRSGLMLTCDLQIAPLGDGSEQMLVLVQTRQIAGQLGKALQASSVAKTAIGLADMLAHEIKNPLAGITGAAQLLSMGLSKQDQEMTDLILQETRRIVDLLAQVEQFGDLRKPKLKALNIHDILERARKSASLGSAAHMTFQDDYDPSLPATLGDPDQLLQVFANLFANAAEVAEKPGGTITIRTYFELGLRLKSEDGDHPVPLQVEICDNGPGIPDTMLDSVFEPFVSSRENGTGLGLALVSKILSEHHGTIVVNSRPGKTCFRLSLPMAPNPKGSI